MNELITITTGGQGQPVVSARELHEFLGAKRQFADWVKHRIKKYGLVENQDYTTVSLSSENGGRSIEYVLTIDAAKELAMVEGNAKGKQARQYFIDAEKALRLSLAQPTIQPAQPDALLVNHARRIADLEQQLQTIVNSQQQAARLLLEVERSADPLPEETTRMKVQRIVNGFCRIKNVGQQEVWRLIYDRLYYLYRVNIRAHAKMERESWLDVAERKGFMDKIYAIASAELQYSEN